MSAPISEAQPAPSLLLLSSNIASLFEEPATIPAWLDEIRHRVTLHDCDICVLHMQEVAGKDREVSLVRPFAERLVSECFPEFWASTFVFESEIADAHFTGVATMYFVKRALLPTVRVYDFSVGSWADVETTLGGAVVGLPAALPHRKLPGSAKRKGFIQCRLDIQGRHLDFINVHLFHDNDNTIAAHGRAEAPSVYAIMRANALSWALSTAGVTEEVPAFIFGDYNFRLDLGDAADWLSRTDPDRTPDLPPLLEIGPKEFIYRGARDFLRCSETHRQLLAFNKETAYLRCTTYAPPPNDELEMTWRPPAEWQRNAITLLEQDIGFAPTYPKLCPGDGDYDPKRAPAWPDRVLYTPAASRRIGRAAYDSITRAGKALGDHDPIMLAISLQ